MLLSDIRWCAICRGWGGCMSTPHLDLRYLSSFSLVGPIVSPTAVLSQNMCINSEHYSRYEIPSCSSRRYSSELTCGHIPLDLNRLFQVKCISLSCSNVVHIHLIIHRTSPVEVPGPENATGTLTARYEAKKAYALRRQNHQAREVHETTVARHGKAKLNLSSTYLHISPKAQSQHHIRTRS